MAIADFAAGVQGVRAAMLERAIKEAEQQEKIRQFEAELALNQNRLGEDARQFDTWAKTSGSSTPKRPRERPIWGISRRVRGIWNSNRSTRSRNGRPEKPRRQRIASTTSTSHGRSTGIASERLARKARRPGGLRRSVNRRHRRAPPKPTPTSATRERALPCRT
jgi:hypothetical protein